MNLKLGNVIGPTDALVIFSAEPVDPSVLLDGLPEPVKRAVNNGLKDFTGKLRSTRLVYPDTSDVPRVLLTGLGEMGASKGENLENVRQAYGTSVSELIGIEQVNHVVMALPKNFTPDMGQAASEGALLGGYQFDVHKTGDKDKQKLKSLMFLTENEQVEEAVRRGELIAHGTLLARDLSNEPSNHLTPTQLAEKAEAVAEVAGLGCEIFDKATLEAKGFRTLLAVAQGSDEEPRFIILEYTPDGKGQDTIVLLGKGITLDTGGYSIKSQESMLGMKHDMSGAAAVIGAMQVIGQLKPNVRVIGLVAATENAVNGSAIKPGDVVTSYGGKTIEILNTDAEGRLVLADALGWTAQYNSDAVIDLATLTGAVITALGHECAGAMGTNTELMDKVKAAAEKTGERVWELPLWDAYDKAIESKVADVQNIGDGTAGAIAGGAFLKKFAEGYPWVHLDIAGTAFDAKGDSSTVPSEGGTGWGVRLLTELVFLMGR